MVSDLQGVDVMVVKGACVGMGVHEACDRMDNE